MPSHIIPPSRYILGALALAFSLGGAAQAAPASSAVQAVTITADGALRRPVAPGIYEAAYSPATRALYVASAEATTGTQGGVIYKLDPETLQTLGMTHTDDKNFGLAMNPSGTTLFITNSLDASVSAMDTASGRIKMRTKFTERSKDGSAYGPRKVIYDAAQKALYVGGVGDPGVIWHIDADTLQVKSVIQNAGKWVTGLLLDPETHRLYAANGGGEVLVIDTRESRILERWTPGDGKEWLLLNLALDKARHRLYVTDNSKRKAVAVFDTRTGKMTNRLDKLGDSLDIQFDAQRDRLYVSHRQAGTFSIVDANTLETVRTFALPAMPNSVLIGPDRKAVYVTIKTPPNKDYSASGAGSIARIALP
ncbi:YncE family protein [Castellaniella sp.]|uniref:YncE family protein n=1 Tax=Castellaniella sp. TaxID=1955812 RepID=UPI003C78E484